MIEILFTIGVILAAIGLIAWLWRRFIRACNPDYKEKP